MFRTDSAFIIQPRQPDPKGKNLDYLHPRKTMFSDTPIIAQKQPERKEKFDIPLRQANYDFIRKAVEAKQKPMPKYPYTLPKQNKSDMVGAGKLKSDNVYQHTLRMLRQQADNFENPDNDIDDVQANNLKDTVPLTDQQGKFIGMLENLSELRTNIQSPSEPILKPERGTELVHELLQIGVSLNKQQLEQLKSLIMSTFTGISAETIQKHKATLTIIFRALGLILELLRTVRTQDNEKRQRSLNSFFNEIVDNENFVHEIMNKFNINLPRNKIVSLLRKKPAGTELDQAKAEATADRIKRQEKVARMIETGEPADPVDRDEAGTSMLDKAKAEATADRTEREESLARKLKRRLTGRGKTTKRKKGGTKKSRILALLK